MDEICKECQQKPIKHKRLGLCKTCYTRGYMRAYYPKLAERKRANRKGNGNICACGCGQECYRGKDKVLLGHRAICACGCGQRVIWERGKYLSGHGGRGKTGRKASIETRLKMSRAQKGKSLTPEHCMAISRGLRKVNFTVKQRQKLIRKWSIYRDWRNAVFTRDNYTCQICGARNGKGKNVYLEADHIISVVLRPDLILSVANGRTLCRDCHRHTVTWGKRIRNARGYKQKIVMQFPLEMITL